MTKPTDYKKEARKQLESFKKRYKVVCKTENIESHVTTKELSRFFDRSFLDDNVTKELMKLVGEESLEIKLIFNSVTSLRCSIPQKKWFLGSSHSTDILPRQPCNSQMFTVSTLDFGTIGTSKEFKLNVYPLLTTAPHKILLSNTECLIEIANDQSSLPIGVKIVRNKAQGKSPVEIQLNEDTKTITNVQEYITKKDYTWEGEKLTLTEEGTIRSGDNLVTIYLDSEKITTQKIIQWELNKNNVILLFESYFIAYGTIRKAKSGLLIDCTELTGTYPTESFATSPDGKYFVRKALFIKEKPKCTLVPEYEPFKQNFDYLYWMQQAKSEWCSHGPCEEYAEKLKKDEERQHFMASFCSDMYLFLAAHNSKPFPEDHYLSPREELICRTQRVFQDDALMNKSWECTQGRKECNTIKEFLKLAKTYVTAYTEKKEIEDYDKETIQMMFHMMEYFNRVLCQAIYNPEFAKWKSFRAVFMRHQLIRVDRVLFYPIDIYERFNALDNIGADQECANRDILDWYITEKENPELCSIVVIYRPDILLFGCQPTFPPIGLIKKFAEHWDEIRDEKTDKRKLFEKFLSWSSLAREPQKPL